MPAQLLALSDGPSILLDKPILLLGRHPECDIQLNSRKVSRRHCCVAQVHDYLVVRDLGSTNGVRINGERVVEGKLRSGDELTVGNFRYRVAWDGSDAQPPPNVEPPKHATLPLADKDLENAEEPVELDESADASIPAAKPVGPAKTPKSEPGPTMGSTTSSSPSSHLLPDKLNLMPGSSVIKPGSHPG
jgi:predicted component of type VI protein secretion system